MKRTLILMTMTAALVLAGGCKKDPAVDPNVVITTAAITDITPTSASGGGEITYDGGKTITAYGVCWSEKENPTLADSKTEDGEGTGTFISALTGLEPGHTYHVRAYAVNANGVYYGNDVTFSTGKVVPEVKTASMRDVTFETAVTGGTVTYDGGDIVTRVGVCWGMEENPDLSGDHTEDELSADGTFVSEIDGLEADRTYYVRAYAINSVGIAYGDQISFGTSSEPCIEAMKDAALQAFVVENFDLNNDGKIQISEAGEVVAINAPGLGITTLEGVEQFPNLVDLRVNANALTTVDLKALKNLEIFWGFDNPDLTAVDIVGLENLKYFHCQNTKLAALDLSSAVNMTELNLYYTALTSLDVSACAPLQTLNLEGTPVDAVDASGKTSLWYLNVRLNEKMKSLKVKGCSSLQELYADNTCLTELDASGLESLRILWAFTIKGDGCAINADNCPALEYLHAYCGDNAGVLTACSARNCPALREYRVFGNPNITEVDFTGSFTSDNDFGEINLDGAHLTRFVAGKEQKSLTYLNIHQNRLTSLDLRDMPGLTYLHCGISTIEDLRISGSSRLQEAYVNGNADLRSLDFTGCGALRILWAFENAAMTSLDVSACKNLYYLDAHMSPVANDQYFEDMPALWYTVLWSTQIPKITYKNVPELQHVNLENAPVKEFNISGASKMNDDVPNLMLINTQLTTLDITGAPNLRYLAARNIPTLKTITMTSNPGLKYLYSWATAQESIDLRGCADEMQDVFIDANESLKTIYMRSNQTIANFHHDASAEVIVN